MKYRFFLSTFLMCSLLAVVANAQSNPGSFDELLESDFAPLQPSKQLQNSGPSQLHAPLILGPKEAVQLPAPPTIVEPPKPRVDGLQPAAIVLPDLTMPTPENSSAEFFDQQKVLRPPQLGNDPNNELELLPFSGNGEDRLRQPTSQAPRPFSYGSSSGAFLSPPPQRLAIPVQVDFYSFGGGFGFQPPGFGYLPYGGYVPYRGYRPYGGYGGINCPYGRR